MANQLHIPIFIIVHLKTEINFITKWSSFEKYYSLTELLLFMQMSALNSIHLDFQHPHHLSSRLTNGKLPLWSTATIPVFEKLREGLRYNQPAVTGTLIELRDQLFHYHNEYKNIHKALHL